MLGVETRRADRSPQEVAYERLEHDSCRLRCVLKHGILIDFKLWVKLFPFVTSWSCLQGGNIGFFQALCLLGYCLFPIDAAAIVSVFVKIRLVRCAHDLP